MLKIITGSETKKLDEVYIKDNGISSFDLMERASEAFCLWFVSKFDQISSIAVFCGIGNNGGDGLAISRILVSKGYSVSLFFMGDKSKASIDFKKNLGILPRSICVQEANLQKLASLKDEIFIDAIFGAGINRPLDGAPLELVRYLNGKTAIKISVDMPSGLPTDSILKGEAFISDHTVSFQFPKLSLLFPEHAKYTGELTVLDIGISSLYFDSFQSQSYFFSKQRCISIFRLF